MSSVYVRVRETPEHCVVAACDKTLLGKTLVQGELHFKVSKEFYGGDLVDLATFIEYMRRATIANMVGEITVNAAIEAGLVHRQAVIYIDGHPHAQWVRL